MADGRGRSRGGTPRHSLEASAMSRRCDLGQRHPGHGDFALAPVAVGLLLFWCPAPRLVVGITAADPAGITVLT